MKKILKKSLAVIMVVIMTLTAAPLSGFVGLELPSLFDLKAEAATYSGFCGDNLKYKFDNNKLSITGTGDMWSYSSSDAPWDGFKKDIYYIDIQNGVTSIGDSALNGLVNVYDIVLPNSILTIGDHAFSYSYISYISLGNSLKSIGKYAFEDCFRLQDIVIPDSVITIDDWAFSKCNQAKNLTLGNSLEVIGVGAFYGCSSFQNVTINNSVKQLGDSAFNLCSGLQSVSIGNNVESIGNCAFYRCTSLERIIISDSVKNIGEDVFYECRNISSIDVSANNKYYSSDEYGVLFDKNKTKLILYPGGNNRTNYTIPDSVTSVEKRAFYECYYLTNVNFGNGLTVIGEIAFANCDNLAVLEMNDNLTTIGQSAFSNCDKLTVLETNDNLTTIGQSAFANCELLKSVTIGGSVKTIGSRAFSGCNNLSNLKLGNSIEIIGSYAFSGCSFSTICLPESVKSIGAYAFHKCNYIEYLHIPGSVEFIDPNILGTTSICICNDEENGFVKSFAQENGISFRLCAGNKGTLGDICGDNARWSLDLNTKTLTISGTGDIFCTWGDYDWDIKTVNIQEGITGIRDRLFLSCENLEKVSIANTVAYIGDYAFYNCKALKNVTFGENSKLQNIGYEAFYSCTQLESIELPDSLINIENGAFSYCSILKKVVFGADSRLETIGKNAFSNCSSLVNVSPLPQSIKKVGVAAFKDTAIYKRATWTDGVLYIGNCLVDSYQTLKECNVKEGTVCIADEAFIKRSSLIRVTIPTSVKSIGTSAFEWCSKLTDITLSDGVKHIGKDAFLNTGYTRDYNNTTDGIWYIGKYLIQADTSISGTRNIKEDVICIADYAFRTCESLRVVTIPVGVTIIGDHAFDHCVSLNSINLPTGVTYIGNGAFYGCFGLQSVEIPDSVTFIGKEAFSATMFTRVTIPDSVEKIGALAFNCPLTVDENNKYYSSDEVGALFSKDKKVLIQYPYNKRTGYSVPYGVTKIGADAFYYGEFLETISLPDTVKVIEESAFENCRSMQEMILPEGLFSIAPSTFAYCEKLKSVTIPNSVRFIESKSFYNCHELSQVAIPDSVRSIGDKAFYECALTDVKFSSNLKSIGSEAFMYNGIESIHITSATKYIGESAFFTLYLRYICSETQDCYAKTYADKNDICFKICKGDRAILEGISIKTPASKKEYFVGDTLDITGLALTADYSDNTSETVTSGFACTPLILATEGVQDITVVYGDVTSTFSVNVKAVEMESIDIVTVPDKTVYNVGETLQTSGLTIEAIYNNGKTETVSASNCTCTPTLFETAGNHTITVTYKEKTCSFTVSVIELSKVEIINFPDRRTYFVGEKLNKSGLVLKATYSDGSSETVSGNFTCSPTEFSVPGTQTITVTYNNKISTFNVEVVPVGLISIEISKLPQKMSYFVGDEIDVTGLTLEATYNDASTDTITSGFACSPTKFTTAGTQIITVSYGDKTCSFDVTVYDVSISTTQIITNPIKTEYYIGEKLDTTGLVLDVRYNNGKTERVTSGFTCYPDKLNTAGTHTISVYYGDRYSGCFDVTVTAVKLESVDIKAMPTKLEYFVGDVLDVSGLVLTATYSNGDSEAVMSGFTCAPTTLDTVGTQKITVTYREKTCSYNVTVNMIELTGIEINTLPRKTEYFVGDSLDVSGLSLTATYNNGESEVVTSGFAVQPEVLTTAGVQKITVSYEGKTAEFVVSSHILGNWETVVEATIDNDGYKVRICSTCKKVFEETIIPRHRVLNDERSRTEVIVPGDMFEGSVELRVVDAQNDSYFEVEKNSGRLVGAYDISLLVNGVETQPTGAVTVRIKVTRGIFNYNWKVYHIDPVTGACEKIPCEYKNGYVIFEADSFSYYAIIDETPEVELSLIRPSVQKINFGDTLVLRLEEVKIPEGHTVKWFVEGAGVSTTVSDDGLECRVTSIANGNPTISAKLVDEEENVATNADGEEISDEIALTSKAGFWQKFISFFKNLFGINRVIY